MPDQCAPGTGLCAWCEVDESIAIPVSITTYAPGYKAVVGLEAPYSEQQLLDRCNGRFVPETFIVQFLITQKMVTRETRTISKCSPV